MPSEAAQGTNGASNGRFVGVFDETAPTPGAAVTGARSCLVVTDDPQWEAALSDALARRALEPARRARILARTRAILNQNFPIIAEWLDGHGTLFTYAPPDAGAIVYVRYHHAINSTELVNRLRQEKSVLIVPGDHFGMDGYLRIGFGDEPGHLRAGLDRAAEFIADLGIADLGLRNADGEPNRESAINRQSEIRNPH